MRPGNGRGGAAPDVRLLVDRAQRGEREALEELYLLHFDRIYSYLHLSLGNRHDAEDLTTQTFLKMLEAIGRFRWQSAPFSAWLFRIAHNLAMDHFRARRRVRTEEEVSEPPGAEESSAEEQALDSLGEAGMLELIERWPRSRSTSSARSPLPSPAWHFKLGSSACPAPARRRSSRR